MCHKHRERESEQGKDTCTALPACAAFLFMSGDFYQEQAVPCSTVGSSSDSALCVLMMHHPRHYMTHSNMH